MIKPFTRKKFEGIEKENNALIIENQKLIQIIREKELIIINLEKMLMDFGDPDY